MSQSGFRFEQATSDAPVMRGPGVEVAFTFSEGNAWDYELRFDGGPTATERCPTRWLVRPAKASELDIGPSESRRIANPVYQAFVPHELAGARGHGLCALLTGSGFDHHFSAVFSLYPDPEMPARIIFEVDLADRCRVPVEELAATYVITELAASIRAIDAGLNRVAWQAGSAAGGRLELIAVPPAVIGNPTSLASATRVQVQARIDPGTHTQRLHYRWCWASCSDLTRYTA